MKSPVIQTVISMRTLLVLITTGWLTGCATLNQAECEAGEWEQVGYRDGVSGHDANRLAAHQYACNKHDIEPDNQRYLAGYTRGLLDFCIPGKGFVLGINGDDYHYACPAELEGEFLLAYIQGLHQFRHQLEWRYQILDGRLFSKRHDQRVLQASQTSGSDATEEQIRVARQVNYLRDVVGDLRAARYRANHMIRRAVAHLDATVVPVPH